MSGQTQGMIQMQLCILSQKHLDRSQDHAKPHFQHRNTSWTGVLKHQMLVLESLRKLQDSLNVISLTLRSDMKMH